MVELRNLNDVYVALSEAIATGDVEGGRLIVETWLPVAGNDPAFISLARAIKTMAAQKNSGTNIPGGSNSVSDKDPWGELRSEYLNNRVDILQKIADLLNDDDFESAFELFERYKPVVFDDDDFVGLQQQAMDKKNAKQCEGYLKALDVLPEDDYPIRLNILNRIVKLVPSDENKQRLDQCQIEMLKTKVVIGLPSTGEIANVNAAMLAMVHERNLMKRVELCNTILKYYPEYRLERIRCERKAAPLVALTHELAGIPENDYEARIRVYNKIVKIDDSPEYKFALSECKKKLNRQKQDKIAMLTTQYRNNKEQIINNLSSFLANKYYTNAARILEDFYQIAQKDNDFKPCVKQAKEAALEVRQANIHKKMLALPASDYTERKALCEEALKYKPFDEYYLSQYNICERMLLEQGLRNTQNLETEAGEGEAIDVAGEVVNQTEPMSVASLPAVVNTKKYPLKEITDNETIERIAAMLNAGAQFCTKSSEIAKKVGNFMLKYSNSPLIQLFSTKVPEVSPVMNTIGNVSNAISDGLAVGASVLSEAAKDTEGIAQAVVMVIRSGTHLAQSCKALGSDIANSEAFKQFVALASKVTSLVVGSHYMRQISAELGDIQSALSKISDFQDTQYQSQMDALCAQVTRMINYRVEIMENTDLRQRELLSLSTYEQKCMELLGQANHSIIKDMTLSLSEYDTYINNSRDMFKWYQYQDALMNVWSEVCKLIFTLNLGCMSAEHCYMNYRDYEKRTLTTREKLRAYHSQAVDFFEIDCIKLQRKNMEKGIKSIFSRDCLAISEEEMEMINRMMLKPAQASIDQTNLFQQDLRIVFKDNRLYYVANGNDVQTYDVDMDWVIDTLKNA